MENSYTPIKEAELRLIDSLQKMRNALSQKDDIGQAASERYVDLSLQYVEKIVELKGLDLEQLNKPERELIIKLKHFRNRLTHRYYSLSEENAREIVLNAFDVIEKIVEKITKI